MTRIIVALIGAAFCVTCLAARAEAPFRSGPAFSTGPEPWGTVIADFDHDGRADVAIADYTQPGVAAVLLGDGHGGFATASATMSTRPRMASQRATSTATGSSISSSAAYRMIRPILFRCCADAATARSRMPSPIRSAACRLSSRSPISTWTAIPTSSPKTRTATRSRSCSASATGISPDMSITISAFPR